VGRLRALTVALLCALLVATMALGAHASTPRERQWGLEQIGAPQAWETSRGGGVVVAIVDTGVDLTHPDLAPRLLRDGDGRVIGRDEVDPGSAPQDENGHGTLVAGVAAAAHDAGLEGNGIAGVAPGARIMPVRVLDEDGMGSMSNLDAGIRWAVDNGADVINLSLESAVPLPGEVMATGPDDAVNYAWERGVPVVAAAGNGTAATGTPFTDYRPSTPVLLVGATDQRDRRAAFSDAGRRDMVLAPGVDIISSHCRPCGRDAEHGYATASGTSLAAPHAAGAVALLLAAGLDHQQALQRLRETAVEVSGGGVAGTSGHGRIDAAAALAPTRVPRTTAQAADRIR
jgi:subtilisin family serine protease